MTEMSLKPEWEAVDTYGSVHRMPVPGGWIYTVRSTNTEAENIVFVPTPKGEATSDE